MNFEPRVRHVLVRVQWIHNLERVEQPRLRSRHVDDVRTRLHGMLHCPY